MVVIYAEKPDMAEKIASSLGGPSFHKQDKKNGYYEISYKGKQYQVHGATDIFAHWLMHQNIIRIIKTGETCRFHLFRIIIR